MDPILAYKLTDQNDQTYGQTQWGEGVTHKTDGTGELCGPGWIHAYTHPLLAVLLNPIHGNFFDPHLWECDCTGSRKDDRGLKVGFTEIATVRRIPLPEVTNDQRVLFAIRCSRAVRDLQDWTGWAGKWESGEDRTESAGLAVAGLAWGAWWSAAASAARLARSAVEESARLAAEAASTAALKVDLIAIAQSIGRRGSVLRRG